MLRTAVLVLVWMLSTGTVAWADPWGQVTPTVGFLPGGPYRDCDEVCPEMIEVPPGSFTMGSVGLNIDEGPPHPVTIAYPIAIGRYEITFGEWDACVRDGGCNRHMPGDNGWGRGRRPVMNVSWLDTQAYVQWLRRKTGKPYRLLSEAEWEYAARAGSAADYTWGDEIERNRANCNGCGSPWDNQRTAPVGSFRANAFGLFDLHGNVWEWVEDCYREAYYDTPDDGRAVSPSVCRYRVLRGGSWDFGPAMLRSAYRFFSLPDYRYDAIGFRVAYTAIQ
jgi:formylglycine-generating enzyme required for sulfatase activity